MGHHGRAAQIQRCLRLAWPGQGTTIDPFRENLAIDLNTMGLPRSNPPNMAKASLLECFLPVKDRRCRAEHVNPDGNLNYSVVLYQEDGQYVWPGLMDHALANSLIHETLLLRRCRPAILPNP